MGAVKVAGVGADMNKRLKELAEQAGFDVEDRTNEIWFDEGWSTSIVERFADLVRQDYLR